MPWREALEMWKVKNTRQKNEHRVLLGSEELNVPRKRKEGSSGGVWGSCRAKVEEETGMERPSQFPWSSAGNLLLDVEEETWEGEIQQTTSPVFNPHSTSEFILRGQNQGNWRKAGVLGHVTGRNFFFLVGEELTFLSKCMSMNTQSSCCPKGRYLNWHSQEMIKFHIWYIPCFLAKWEELMLSLWIRGWSILHKWLDSLHVSFPQDLCFNSRVCFHEAKVSFPIYFEAIMAGAHGKAAHVIVVGMEEMWRKRLGFHHHFQVQVPRTLILPGRWAVLL